MCAKCFWKLKCLASVVEAHEWCKPPHLICCFQPASMWMSPHSVHSTQAVLCSIGLTYSSTDIDLAFTERKEVLPIDSPALLLSLLQDSTAGDRLFYPVLCPHCIAIVVGWEERNVLYVQVYCMHCVVLLHSLSSWRSNKRKMFIKTFSKKADGSRKRQSNMTGSSRPRSIPCPQRVKFGIDFPHFLFPQWELSEVVNDFLKYNRRNKHLYKQSS